MRTLPCLLAVLVFIPNLLAASDIRGRVTGPDGQPLPNVRVLLLPQISEASKPSTAHTGPDGRFVFSDVSGETRYDNRWIVATKPGRALGGMYLGDIRYPPESLTIVLERPETTTVALSDPRGKPLAEAETALGYLFFRDARGRRVALYERHLAHIPRSLTHPTDEQGRVTVEGLPPESRFRLDVRTEAYGTQYQFFDADSDREQSSRLHPVGRLAGRVLADDPQAVQGLKVTATSLLSKPGGGRLLGAAETRTDEEGRFDFPALPAGTIRLDVEVDDSLPYRQPGNDNVELAAGSTAEATVRLVNGVRVRGRVVNRETGDPVAGTRLRVWSRAGGTQYVATGENGEYAATVAPGNVGARLIEIPPRYLKPIRSSRGVRAKPGTPDVTLSPFKLKRGVALPGRVVDEKDRPVEGAWVTASWTKREGSLSTSGWLTVKTDGEGRFVLKPVPAGTQLKLKATARDRAVRQYTQLRAGERESVRLTVVPAGVATLSGRVVDQSEEAVAGARLELRGGSRRFPGDLGSGFYDAPRWKATTGENGRFRFKRPVARLGGYRLEIEADGMLTHKRSIKPEERPSGALGEIVLQRVKTVRGRVVDRDGTPLESVTVFSLGARGDGRNSTTTGADGRFVLEALHPRALFLFARRENRRFTGRAVPEAGEPVTLRMSRRDEPPPEPALRTTRFSHAKRRDLLVRLLRPVLQRYRKSSSDHFPQEILQLLLPYDREFVRERLNELQGNRARARLLAAMGHLDDALAAAESVESPYRRVSACARVADAAQTAARKRTILARAAVHAKTVQDPAHRVVVLGKVAEKLIDLGDREAAARLLETARPTAGELTPAEWSGFALGRFAETLALVDTPAAVKLVESLKDKDKRNRHFGNMAHELAGIRPKRSAKILKRVEEGFHRDRYAQRVCYRMVRVDPERARRIATAIGDTEHRAYAYGVMASSMAERDPAEAQRLLRKAFDTLEPMAGSPHRREDALPIAVSLVRIAETVDPNNVCEYFWRALAFDPRGDPAPVTSEHRRVERAREAAMLAMLPALYGAHADLAAELMAPVFQTLEEKDFDSNRRAEAVYAAMMLVDPERALRWQRKHFAGAEGRELRLVYPPQPWRVMAAMLTDSEEALWEYVNGEVLRHWVVGQEDL